MAANHPETELVPYLRGELSGDERRRVEEHLEQCAQCRESRDASAALLDELSRAVNEVPTPDWAVYRAELHRKLAARQTGSRRLREFRLPVIHWPSLAMAGAAIAVFVITLIMHRGPGFETPGVDQLAMEQDMGSADVGLLVNYRVVEHLDLLENYDVIEHLDELAPGNRQNNETPS